jgi:hypothetical protein
MKVYCVWEEYETDDDLCLTNLLGIYHLQTIAEESCEEWKKIETNSKYSYYVTEEEVQW